MKKIILIIAFITSIDINAASRNTDKCIPDEWDGYWSTIKQCYFDKIDRQTETLGYLKRDDDLSAFQESVKKACSKEAEEFSGEMTKQTYWDCFTESLQSEIDKGLAKASNNVRTFNSINWDKVNHCNVTYFSDAVETRVGSHLKGNKDWTSTDFPKEVMNARCEIVADDDGLIIYEESKDWVSGKHFFYISIFDDYLISINSQPEVTSSHAQWTVTEFAELQVESAQKGCFVSKEIRICVEESFEKLNN
jgi:hypothetical protein